MAGAEAINVGDLILKPEVDSINTENQDTADFRDIEPELTILADSTNYNIEPEQETSSGQSVNEEKVNETVKSIPPNERINFSVNSEISYLSLSNFKTDEGKTFFEEGTNKEKELQKVMIRTEILRDKYKSAPQELKKIQ